MASLRRVAAVVAALMLPLGTAACTLDPYGTASSSPGSSSPGSSTGSGGSSDGPTSTASPVSETTAPVQTPGTDATPTSGPDDVTPGDGTFPSGGERESGDGTGDEVGTLVDMRLGAHGTFDRVVLQLDGPDIPGWDVQYVDTPIGDPSGTVVDVSGDAVLQVLLHPVAYPEDGHDPYDGPPTVRISGTDSVDEVVLSSIFEGQLQAFVGVHGGRQSFRVYGMSDPSRVVIEVQNPAG
ncbi:MAG: hypothetical protein KQH57_03100 [Actinomycetales bacterium]|nr:hypothetical protein [Actinomycetales bacterium]